MISKKLVPLTLGGLGIGVTEFVMMGLLPDIAKDLSVSIPQAGYLISAYALGVVVGAPVLGAAAGKYPPKKVLLALMVMFTLFNACSVFAPNFTILLISRFFAGLPHGAFFGVGSVVASRIAQKGKEAQAVSMMFAGLTIANIFGVPLGTFIGHNFSWRFSFGIVVALGLITLLSLKLSLPALASNANSNLKKEMGFFKKLDAWIIILMISIGTGGLFTWYSYIANLMTDVAGFSADNVTYILMLAGLGMLCGNIFGGYLADKFSPAKATASLLFGMAIILVIVHYTSHHPAIALITTFITGFMSFSLVAPIQMLMIRTAKDAEMIAAAVSQASFNIGNALGAYFGGLPLTMGYDFTWPAYIGAFMAIIGGFFALALLKSNKKKSLQPKLELN